MNISPMRELAIFAVVTDAALPAAKPYRDLMPVVPVLDTGQTLLLQWIAVVTLACVAAHEFSVPSLLRRKVN